MARKARDHHAEELQLRTHEVSLLARIIRWIYQLRPVRVLQNYSQNRGPLLAAGLSFHLLFAAFAAMWLGFTIGGLLLEVEPALRDAVFQFINSNVPGLIDTGTGEGAIKQIGRAHV